MKENCEHGCGIRLLLRKCVDDMANTCTCTGMCMRAGGGRTLDGCPSVNGMCSLLVFSFEVCSVPFEFKVHLFSLWKKKIGEGEGRCIFTTSLPFF